VNRFVRIGIGLAAAGLFAGAARAHGMSWSPWHRPHRHRHRGDGYRHR